MVATGRRLERTPPTIEYGASVADKAIMERLDQIIERLDKLEEQWGINFEQSQFLSELIQRMERIEAKLGISED